jgi:hypothetical protein
VPRDFYDSPAGYVSQSGGAHIVRVKLIEAIEDGGTSANAKLFGWNREDSELAEKDLTIKLFPFDSDTFTTDVSEDTVLWAIRRCDAPRSDGTYGRWEPLIPSGGSNRILYGECAADHDKGASGTIDILDSSDDSPLGYSVDDVRNVYADLLDGAKCHIVKIGSTWMLIAGECNL